ncbi:SDR family oxidoreductase [Serratia marcescens]|uniref:SDR family oxidoreductase n=1 Tax=Serratia marcescens TaxID=615 RepID=UPI001BD3F11D|nr:SDR family oxidoreductase [Serratia marcescens]
MSRLQGKYALITGGTSGIGLETARQFIAEGATVAITGRSQSTLDAAGQALAGKALLLLSDAGDVTHRPLQEWDEQSYQRLMDINLKGPFFLIQALLPLLANPSSVILCGSVSAHIGLPQSSAYAASKAGLLSLARTLSGELHARGIRVNGLSPGPTETPALGKLGLAEADEQALRDDIRALVPIGRMGSALELAKAAVFLAADESAFMVGAELQMDGGVGNL